VVGLAAWTVLRYFRESITLEGDAVLVTHVLGKRRFLRWPGWSSLDWIVAGTVIGAGLWTGLRALTWLGRPDS
jgi:hypothetical protein